MLAERPKADVPARAARAIEWLTVRRWLRRRGRRVGTLNESEWAASGRRFIRRE